VGPRIEADSQIDKRAIESKICLPQLIGGVQSHPLGQIQIHLQIVLRIGREEELSRPDGE